MQAAAEETHAALPRPPRAVEETRLKEGHHAVAEHLNVAVYHFLSSTHRNIADDFLRVVEGANDDGKEIVKKLADLHLLHKRGEEGEHPHDALADVPARLRVARRLGQQRGMHHLLEPLGRHDGEHTAERLPGAAPLGGRRVQHERVQEPRNNTAKRTGELSDVDFLPRLGRNLSGTLAHRLNEGPDGVRCDGTDVGNRINHDKLQARHEVLDVRHDVF